jgi:hypothetical protein
MTENFVLCAVSSGSIVVVVAGLAFAVLGVLKATARPDASNSL